MPSFSAEVDSMIMKSNKVLNAIVKQSTNDAIVQASRTAVAMARGGERRPGYVPRDTGVLAGSLISTLSGGKALTGMGENSYTFVVVGMEAGDIATFLWTARYAAAQHYGFTAKNGTKIPGWLWVDKMTPMWPSIVAGNVARARARIGI